MQNKLINEVSGSDMLKKFLKTIKPYYPLTQNCRENSECSKWLYEQKGFAWLMAMFGDTIGKINDNLLPHLDTLITNQNYLDYLNNLDPNLKNMYFHQDGKLKKSIFDKN